VQLSDFDFDLPPSLIALRPVEPRDAARLLEVGADGGRRDLLFRDLPGVLRAGDALVFNDTRVIPARLFGRRFRDGSQASVEATLHKRLTANRWSAFMRPGKRLQAGDRISFGGDEDRACYLGALEATVVAKGDDGEVVLAFDLAGPDLDRAIDDRGAMPLPPYIASQRKEDEQDRLDYQTVYAREAGSVAAPTAGLHFTDQLMQALNAAGISSHFVTLDVGAGTFMPVKTEDIAEHRMHAEHGEVSPDVANALNAARADGGRIVCVGTTSLRLIESAADEAGMIYPFADETAIFIKPGYRFRAIDGLITNFHLPRSTLFMLVAALAGLDRIRSAYAHAMAQGYRFYSYGDASLIWKRR
jgi:S-adenosylmethionine:tRNA ribosyltransferase-isomerase